MADGDRDSVEEDDAFMALNSSGECVLGIGHMAFSIHSIKVELSKMNAEKITMTLDCCRTVSRGESLGRDSFVVYLK